MYVLTKGQLLFEKIQNLLDYKIYCYQKMSFYRQLNIIGNNLSFAPVLHCQFAAATGSDYLPLHQPDLRDIF